MGSTYPTRQHFHVRTVGVRRPDHPIWIGSLSLQEIGDASFAIIVAASVLRLETASLKTADEFMATAEVTTLALCI